jgi:DNA repair photolyase
MAWEKTHINTGNNIVEAIAPEVISASRATDIPAFCSDWLIERIKEGYLEWKNPFNSKEQLVSFSKCKAIVFWTKNPEPIFKHLDFLDERIKNYYFQYTVNDYENEGFEPYLPSLENRVKSFIELSKRIGKERVIWRFDPLIMTDKLNKNTLLDKIERIGEQLHKHTNKLVFSFVDIDCYRKVKTNLKKWGIRYIDFSEDDKIALAQGISRLNKKWGLEIATCSEDIDLEEFGIGHNKCIDDELMKKAFSKDNELMEYLKKQKKDLGQRKDCLCIPSKDIGRYGTCKHECRYCYAS